MIKITNEGGKHEMSLYFNQLKENLIHHQFLFMTSFNDNRNTVR